MWPLWVPALQHGGSSQCNTHTPAGEDVFACTKHFDRKTKTLKDLEGRDSSKHDALAADKQKVCYDTL